MRRSDEPRERFRNTFRSVRISVMPPAPGGSAPSAASVRSALEQLLRSSHFSASARATRFIRFIVECALEGRESTLGSRVRSGPFQRIGFWHREYCV
jgi:hypothetical protein